MRAVVNVNLRLASATLLFAILSFAYPTHAHGVRSCLLNHDFSCPDSVVLLSVKHCLIPARLVADSQPNNSGDSANQAGTGSTSFESNATLPNTTNASSDTTATAGTTQQPLKGQAVLNQATELKQLGTAARKLQKSAEDLYGEATTQQVQMTYQPDVIGMGQVVMIPHPQFTGIYLAPRKKWVDEYIGELGELLPLVGDEFQDVIKTFPEEAIAEAKDSFDQLKVLMDDVRARLARLQQLQQAGNYDNKPLAEEAYGINDDMKKAIKDGRDLFRSLKKYSRKKRA